MVHGGWVALQQHRAGKKKCPLETPYFQHMKADGPKQRNQLHKAIDHKVKWHGCQGTYCVQIYPWSDPPVTKAGRSSKLIWPPISRGLLGCIGCGMQEEMPKQP